MAATAPPMPTGEEQGQSVHVVDGILTPDYWKVRWQHGDIGFHKPEVHPGLLRHAEALLHGRSGLTVFFPLCGKTVDMRFLAEMGHKVIGVEYVAMAIHDFFTENGIPFTTENCTGPAGIVEAFHSVDGRITIYCWDLFLCRGVIQGSFDGIWDRGSLSAINSPDREKYATLLLSLMAPDCLYLLETYDYNPAEMAAPPNAVSGGELEELYGARCDIQLLESLDALHKGRTRSAALTWFREEIRLLRLKR